MTTKPEEPRALFLHYWEEEQAKDHLLKELTVNPKLRDQLVEDVIEVCIVLGGVLWKVKYDQILKSLRKKSRWKPYTLRSKREWSIRECDEMPLLHMLKDLGFEVQRERRLHRFKERMVSPTGEICKTNIKTVITSKKRQVLEIDLNESVEELVEVLRVEKDQVRKRVIRAKLRRMGHKGGLRGDG